MAISKIHAIKTTLKKSIDYIMNEAKTDGKLLVTGIDCTPEIADIEFNMTKEYFGKEDKILAHHLIQSFAKGEVDEAKAHNIGVELANMVCENKYQAVVATHIDKDHVHNHIIFNSVSYKSGEKYNGCKTSYKKIREHNDELCQRNGLSVITEAGDKGISYKEWMEVQKGTSWKKTVRIDIDDIIKSSRDFESFILKMKDKKYEIKFGKFIAFKPEDKERFVRGKSLGKEYTEEAIKLRIKMKVLGYEISTYKSSKIYKPKNKKLNRKWPKRKRSLLEVNFSLAISIIKEIFKKKTPSNKIIGANMTSDGRIKKLEEKLKQIRNEKITSVSDLKSLVETTKLEFFRLRKIIVNNDKDKRELEEAIKVIKSYKSNLPFFEEYNKKKIQKKKYYDKFETEIRTFDYSKRNLDELGLKTVLQMDDYINNSLKKIEDFKAPEKEYILVRDKLNNYKELARTVDDIGNKYYVFSGLGINEKVKEDKSR